MKTQTIEVEGLPEGWLAVAYRKPVFGEYYFYNDDIQQGKTGSGQFLIVEKIHPRRIVLEETEEIKTEENSGYVLLDDKRIDYLSKHMTLAPPHKIWREVKETDIPLHKDEPKLSLSVAEIKDACLRVWPDYLVTKVNEFIKENS